MKVILDLSPRALKFLEQKAKEGGRSRKKYMELVLTIHAAVKDNTIKEEEIKLKK
jgi:hypothetical protein